MAYVRGRFQPLDFATLATWGQALGQNAVFRLSFTANSSTIRVRADKSTPLYSDLYSDPSFEKGGRPLLAKWGQTPLVYVGFLVIAVVLSGCGLRGSDRGNVSGYPDDDLGVPVEVYKVTEQRDLHVHLFQPDIAGRDQGAVLFFHGGGYGTTRVEQFERQAQAAADAGMTGVVVEYRVRPEGASRDDSVDDGVDAVAFITENAARLGIDPALIAIAGSSAGGDLAIRATAASDHVTAVALFNPAANANTADFVGDQPVIVFHSREDTIVSFGSAEGFCNAVQNCVLVAFDEGDHGFFNDDPAFTETTAQTIDFLTNLGW